MSQNKQTIITKDEAAKKLTVVREFDAPLAQVWDAWTKQELLDQWWAPNPWKARTKSMDFREGGTWLYYMEGPAGEKQWCRLDYKTIIAHEHFIADDAFCDENGNVTDNFPGMHWKNSFFSDGTGTRVEVEITFATERDIEKIIEMGFKEGFTAAHSNLDVLLERRTTQV